MFDCDLIPGRDADHKDDRFGLAAAILAMIRASATDSPCGDDRDYRRILQSLRHPVASARVRIAANLEAGVTDKPWAIY